jgi:hypothetical protein
LRGCWYCSAWLQYEYGELKNFNNCYGPTWGQWKAITKPTPGNHEYTTPGAPGYFSYFGGGLPAYYAWGCHASWRCYSLNSEIAMEAGSAQLSWLQNDLAANPKQCVLAYWHEPLYSSGGHSPGIAAVKPLWDAIQAAGGDLVLNAHDHVYERFAIRDGIRQITAGTGGRSHYKLGTPVAGSEVRNDTTYGVLKITLHTSSYDWEFIPVAKKTFTDSGSDACR